MSEKPYGIRVSDIMAEKISFIVSKFTLWKSKWEELNLPFSSIAKHNEIYLKKICFIVWKSFIVKKNSFIVIEKLEI